MRTIVATAGAERRLWTADEFLEWLQPGVHSDLIDGEKFRHSPVNFRQRTS